MPYIIKVGNPSEMMKHRLPTETSEPHIIEHTLCRLYLAANRGYRFNMMLDQMFDRVKANYYGSKYMRDIILHNNTRIAPTGSLKDIVYDFKLLFANKEYPGPVMFGVEVLILHENECGKIDLDYHKNVRSTEYADKIVRAYILEHFVKRGFYALYKIRCGFVGDSVEVVIGYCPVSIYGDFYYNNEFTMDYKYKMHWLRSFIKDKINPNVQYGDFDYNKYISGDHTFSLLNTGKLLDKLNGAPVYYADHFGRVTMHPDISKYYERAMCSLEGRYGLTGAEYKVPIRRQCYGNPFYQVLFNFNDVNVRDYFKNTYTNPLYSKSKPRQAIQFV